MTDQPTPEPTTPQQPTPTGADLQQLANPVPQFPQHNPNEGLYQQIGIRPPPRQLPPGVVMTPAGPTADWVNRQEPSYWYNPRRLARYYFAIQGMPSDQPLGLDKQAITNAYNYLQSKNPGTPWYQWNNLPDNDPGLEMLRSVPLPPDELLWPSEQQYASGLGTPHQVAPDGGTGIYSPAADGQIGRPDLGGLTQEQYDKLPTFQKVIFGIMSSPLTQAAPMALQGAAIGSFFGPGPGTAIGAGVGLLAGTYMASNPESPLTKAMMVMDYPRQWTEAGVGSLEQIYGSLTDPAKNGDLGELMSNWYAMLQAGRLAAETATEIDPVNVVKNLMENDKGLNPEWFGVVPGAIAGAILGGGKGALLGGVLGGQAIEAITGQGGLKEGQTWILGQPEPVQVRPESENLVDALVKARREIVAGAAPEDVFQRYSAAYGLSGQFREFLSAFYLDPLQELPGIEKAIGGKLASLAGNERLAVSFETTHGVMEAMQRYGQILRTSDFETLKGLNVAEQFLAGVNKEGTPTWMIKPENRNKVQAFGDYLFGLKPASRASEVLSNGVETFGLLLGQADTPEEMIRFIKGITNTPAELARELSMNMLNSPDGAAIPLMLKDFDANSHLAIWDGTETNRTLLSNMAEATGRTREQVLADWGNEKNFDVMLRQVVDKARASEEPAAKALVAAYEAKELTAAKVQETLKIFAKDHLAYTVDGFRANLFGDLLTHGQTWAVDWFGVKPANDLIRLAQTVKSAQSLVLLGMNPIYLINNAINNVVTMAATGVFGMRSFDEVKAIWERVGVEPVRLKAGAGIGALGDMANWDTLRAASNGAGKLERATRFFSQDLKFLQPFATASGEVEKFSSMQAMTSGFLQGWSRIWKPGTGFDRINPNLEGALRKIDPRLPEFIYASIQGGMNRGEVEAALWSAVGKRSLESYVPGIAETLRMSPDDIRESLRKTGIYEALDAKLKADPSEEGVRAAFEAANKQIEKHFDDLHARQVEEINRSALERSRVEGYQSALDTYDSNQIDWMQEYMTASGDWDRLFLDTLGMEEGKRGVLVRRQYAIETNRWQRYYKRAQAALVGIGAGLGLDNELGRRLVSLGDELEVMWRDFHAAKREEQANFFRQRYKTPAESKIAWDAMNDNIKILWEAAGREEQRINGQMTDVFATHAASQGGEAAAKAARDWRQQAQSFRDEHIKLIDAHFNRIKNMDRLGRLMEWQSFQQAMMPQLLQQLRDNLQGAHELYKAATGQSAEVPAAPEAGPFEVASRGARPPGETPAATPEPATPAGAETAPATPAATPEPAAAPAAAPEPAAPIGATAGTLIELAGEGRISPGYLEAQKAYFLGKFRDEPIRGRAVDELVNLPDQDYISLMTKIKPDLSIDERNQIQRARKQASAILNGSLTDMDPELRAVFERAAGEMARDADAVTQSVTVVPTALEMSQGAEVQKLAGGSPDWYGDVAGLTVYDSQGNKLKRKAAVVEALSQITSGNITRRYAIHDRLLALIYDRVRQTPEFRKVLGEPWDTSALWRLDREAGGMTDLAPAWEEYFALISQAAEYHDGNLPGFINEQFTAVERRLARAEERLAAEKAGFAGAPEESARPAATAVPAETTSTPAVEPLTAVERAALDANPEDGPGTIAGEIKNFSETVQLEESTKPPEAWSEAAHRLHTLKLRRAAQEYGVGWDLMADEWVSGLDDDIRDAVLRFGRDEFLPDRRKLPMSQITEDELRVSLAKRLMVLDGIKEQSQEELRRLNQQEPAVRRGEAPIATPANTAGPGDAPDVQAVQEKLSLERKLEEYQGTMADLNQPAASARQELAKGLVGVYGLSDVEAMAILEVTDARARVWAKANGMTERDWYRTHIAGVEAGKGETERDWYRTHIAGVEAGKGETAMARGGVRFAEDGRAILLAFNSPDVSTAVHEIGHIFRRDLSPADMEIVTNWLADEYSIFIGHKDGEFVDLELSTGEKLNVTVVVDPVTGRRVIGVDAPSVKVSGPAWAEERFARAFERYLADGQAPSTGLANVFARFKSWLLEIYHSLTGSQIDVPLSDKMRKVFGRLLAEEDAAPLGEPAVDPNAGPAAPALAPVTGKGEWFATDGGARRILYQEGATEPLTQETGGAAHVEAVNGEPKAQAVNQPLGSLDSASGTPPTARIEEEAYRTQINPVLDELQRRMLDSTQNQEATLKGTQLDPATNKALKMYLHQVYGQMADAKLGAIRWAENRRDAALLNYSARTGFDELFGVVFPYSFWYTRSAVQWALRAIDRPAYLAHWARLRHLQDQIANSPGFPTRLRGKIKIPAPFLPEWAGDGIYIDPFKQLFPFENLLSPLEKLTQQDAQNARSAEYILQTQAQNEEISAQDATTAIKNHSGPAWERALTQARLENEQGISNPFDFLSLMAGPSLPIQWLYQGVIKGTPEKISPLPITRQVQAATSLMGFNQGRGLNLEGPARRALGLPEGDEFRDYRVDRMLANMAAEGRPVDQIQRAMIDRSGPLFVEAEARVAKMGALSTFGSFIGADLFPEGERQQRALKLEFDKAVEAKAQGDGKALTKFFDAYPEYQARMEQMQSDPEARLRQFLIGSVWDGYMALPDLYKTQYQTQLGEAFSMGFLDKETRNYDNISTAQLAAWAKAMNQTPPEKAGGAAGTPDIPLELATPEVAQAYQDYRSQRDAQFPNIGGLMSIYYGVTDLDKTRLEQRYPQIRQYNSWRTQYMAAHPELIPYLTGDTSKVARADPATQALYYQYQATIDSQYPDIYASQDAYFALPTGQRSGYLAQHPELRAYWDFRQGFMERYPQVIPYLYSVEGLKNKVLGTSGGSSGGGGYSSNAGSSSGSSGGAGAGAETPLSSYELRQYSPALVRQLYAYYLSNQPLGDGALRELRRLYDKSGRAAKGLSFDDYVGSMVAQSFR